LPQLDSGTVTEIDVEDDAKSGIKISSVLKGFDGIEGRDIKAILSEQTMKTPEHIRIIIHNDDGFSMRQD